MEQAIEVTEHMAGTVPVVAVSGEIDLATAPALSERFDALLAAGHATIVTDLLNTTFLDSTGLSVLVNTLKRCNEAGGKLYLVIAQEKILKLFTITGLNKTFPIASSVEEAVSGAAAGDAG